MLKIIFLGTSAGVPTTERGMPSIALKYGSDLMLWDCGEGTQRQLMKYKVGYGSISSIFISHPHLDHFIGLYGLLETLKLSPSPKKVSLFLPGDVTVPAHDFVTLSQVKKGKLYKGKGFSVSAFPVRHCRSSYGFVFQEEEKIKFNEDKAHRLGLKGKMFTEIENKGKIKINNKTIKLEDVAWTKPGRKIVYTGDCTYDKDIIDISHNADLLIHEGTFDQSLKEEAKERLHSTVEDAALVAKKAKVKNRYCFVLSRGAWTRS